MEQNWGFGVEETGQFMIRSRTQIMAKRAKASKSRRTTTGSGRSNGSYRLVEDVMSLTGTLLRGRQEKGADVLEALAGSAREFAGSLTDIPHMRETVHDIANRLDDLAGYVETTSLESMVSDASNFARRHPVMMLALSAGAGVVAIQYLSAGREQKSPAPKPARRARSNGREQTQSEARH
jgi:hypothetical protein